MHTWEFYAALRQQQNERTNKRKNERNINVKMLTFPSLLISAVCEKEDAFLYRVRKRMFVTFPASLSLWTMEQG